MNTSTDTLPPHLVLEVDSWFAKNTGLGGCSDKDVAELSAIFWGVQFDGGRESVDDAMAVVESFGPGTAGLNDTFARQVLLASEVKRLRADLASSPQQAANASECERCGLAPSAHTGSHWCDNQSFAATPAGWARASSSRLTPKGRRHPMAEPTFTAPETDAIEASLADMIHDLRGLHAETTAGTCGKGQTSHHTVAVRDGAPAYRVAEFRHAADAAFCDAAHRFVPALLLQLEEAQRDAARLSELRAAGAEMSNICFNLSQHEGKPLTAEWCASMRSAYKKWDAERSAILAQQGGKHGIP